VLIIVLKKRYFSSLLRNIETFADIVILVAGSERYLGLVREHRMVELQNTKAFSTVVSCGEVRLGIELIDESDYRT
jgi:hypothetical protein